MARDFFQAAELECVGHALGGVGEAAQFSGEPQELANGHLAVGGRAFGRVPEVGFRGHGVLDDIKAGDDGGTSVGA